MDDALRAATPFGDVMHTAPVVFRARARVRFYRDEVARPVRWRGFGFSRLGRKKNGEIAQDGESRKKRGVK
jgi:hypothetical protein